MDDPGIAGPGGQPLNSGPEILLSKFENIAKELAKGAAQGEASYKAAFDNIRRDLELNMMPAFMKLSGMDLIKSSQISSYTKTFSEQEKVVNRYYQVVGSLEDRHAEKMRSTLKGQITDIEKYYNQLKIAAQAAAKTKEEEIAATRKIDMERDRQISSHKLAYHTEAAAGVVSAIGGDLMAALVAPLASIASFAVIFSRMSDIGIAQYKTGGLVGRIRGQEATGSLGEEATRKAFGSLLGSPTNPLGVAVDQAANILGNALAKAPQLLNRNLEPILVSYLQYGMSAEQAMDKVVAAAEATNTSSETMLHNLEFSKRLSQQPGFKQDIMQTVSYINDFTKAIRATGVEQKEANKQARVWTAILNETAQSMGLGQAEITNLQSKLASISSSMSPSHAAGLILATTGKMPTSLASMGQQVASPEFAKNVYGMVSRGLGVQGQMFAPETFGRMMGMGSVNILEAQLIKKAMETGRTSLQQLAAQGLAGSDANLGSAVRGLNALKTPIELLMDVVANEISPAVSEIRDVITNPTQAIPHLVFGDSLDNTKYLNRMKKEREARIKRGELDAGSAEVGSVIRN